MHVRMSQSLDDPTFATHMVFKPIVCRAARPISERAAVTTSTMMVFSNTKGLDGWRHMTRRRAGDADTAQPLREGVRRGCRRSCSAAVERDLASRSCGCCFRRQRRRPRRCRRPIQRRTCCP
jgi:hypothetical protein